MDMKFTERSTLKTSYLVSLFPVRDDTVDRSYINVILHYDEFLMVANQVGV